MKQLIADVHLTVERNGGVVSRVELLKLGMSSAAIGRRVSGGDLLVVVPGVYRLAVTPISPTIRLRAVVHRLGPDALVAGRSAAWWHGLARPTPESVVVLLPPDGSHPGWPGLTVLRRPLTREDRMTLRGLAVTTRARTVLDCAGSADAEAIRDRALQLGTTVASLVGALDRLAPGHGTAAARRLVGPVLGGGVSHPERELLRELRRSLGARWHAGVHVAVGEHVFWLDLGLPGIKLGVEVDGWRVHSQAEAFHTDRERQNLLVAAGWTVLRYTPRQIRENPRRVLAEIATVEAGLSRSRSDGPVPAENSR